MNEKCNKCYWKSLSEDKCIKNLNNNNNECRKFLGYCCECDSNEEEYEYNGKSYCKSCLIEEFGMIVETTEYYTTEDGEYLGDEDDDMIDIFETICKKVKEI